MAITSQPITQPHHVVMVSSGAGSAAAWKLTVDRYGPENVTGLFADVNGEHPDNYRFLHEIMCWVNGPLVLLDNGGKTIWDVFREQRFLGNTRVDLCSRVLKREPMRAWLEANHEPSKSTVVCIGYDIDEGHRIAKAEPNWEPYRLEAPLTWDPVLFKHEAHQMIEDAGIKLPWLTRKGFAHANCGGGCVKAGMKQWRHLIEVDPAEFARWADEEQAIREYLDKDVSILRDRRGGTTKKLPLWEFWRRTKAEPTLDFGDEDWGSCNCIGGWDDEPSGEASEITVVAEVEQYLMARYEQPVSISSGSSDEGNHPMPTFVTTNIHPREPGDIWHQWDEANRVHRLRFGGNAIVYLSDELLERLASVVADAGSRKRPTNPHSNGRSDS